MSNKKFNNKLNFEYEVKGKDFIHAGEAASSIKSLLKRVGFNIEDIRRAAIAIYEAEMNMVIHANGGKIQMILEDNHLKVFFRDNGPGIQNIELAMQEGHSTACEKIRNMGFGAGMGLPNIKRLSDKLEIISKPKQGTQVIIEFYLE